MNVDIGVVDCVYPEVDRKVVNLRFSTEKHISFQVSLYKEDALKILKELTRELEIELTKDANITAES